MLKKRGNKTKAAKASPGSSGDVEKRRAAFRAWLELNNVNANEAAKKADISVSAIYNFLNGDTKSLSSTILHKLALAHNCSVDSILHGRADDTQNNAAPKIKIKFRIGARGSMFVCEDDLIAEAPLGVTLPNGVSAAVVDGDGLAPIPDGWTVFFRDATSHPDALVMKLAVVRFSGGGDRPVVRTILKSSFEGLHSLKAMDGSMTEDVKIVAAHEVVSFALTKISEG